MIKRSIDTDGKSVFSITDKFGNTFDILEGGNLDLFWVCECKQGNAKFIIDSSNKEMFRLLKILFKHIKEKDDKYRPRLVNNEFSWISEDRPVEDANRMNITRRDDSFEIDFIKNEKNLFRICSVCFCNSGSNFQRVEELFMLMYIHLCKTINVDEKNNLV